MEKKIYKIRIKVVEIRGSGKCSANLKVGDTFELNEEGQPVNINFCAWAFNTMWPFVTAMRYGGTLPWEKNPDVTFVSCPDPDSTVVFEISREEITIDNDKPISAF
jgi:uncharacterized repeat protein (TIGR04076 family)